ncbi:MAG TPA: hypothetical protein VLA21_03385 [Candidatus Limnocylindria bacterium]|nr:hypothetical protein [Candidatus Limnocylindria bacterium]
MKRLRRLVWFIASRLVFITSILGLMTVAFYFSMNAANIFVILKDGMAQRALTVMTNQQGGDLDKYFSPAYLALDPRLATLRDGNNPYERYQVTGIDHRLRLEWVWAWPWEDIARATVTENVPAIDGRIRGEYRETTPQERWSPPRWPSARYDVILIRENGQWHIRELQNERAYTP